VRRAAEFGVAIAVIAVAALGVAMYAFVPSLLVDDAVFKHGSSDAVNREDKRLKARNDVRTSGIALVTLVGLVTGSVLTWRTIRITRDGHVADRYAKGAEALASAESASQLAGIHLLASVARASRRDHWAAIRLLTQYLRDCAGLWAPERLEPAEPRVVPPGLDEVAAALGSRRTRWDGHHRLDLAGLDLRNVDFTGADLRQANFNDSNLSGAFLRSARLQRASFVNTVLLGAHLDDARFRGADLTDASLDEARVNGADFRRARLTRASLEGARGAAKGLS
jgi:hypothetical protein